MSANKRHGNKWTVNEVLSLQREYELLGLDIDTIAAKHQRTPQSIMFKLSSEGFADYNTISANYNSSRNIVLAPSVSSESTNEQSLDSRVETLESDIGEIKSMVKQLLSVKNDRSSNLARF